MQEKIFTPHELKTVEIDTEKKYSELTEKISEKAVPVL